MFVCLRRYVNILSALNDLKRHCVKSKMLRAVVLGNELQLWH